MPPGKYSSLVPLSIRHANHPTAEGIKAVRGRPHGSCWSTPSGWGLAFPASAGISIALAALEVVTYHEAEGSPDHSRQHKEDILNADYFDLAVWVLPHELQQARILKPSIKEACNKHSKIPDQKAKGYSRSGSILVFCAIPNRGLEFLQVKLGGEAVNPMGNPLQGIGAWLNWRRVRTHLRNAPSANRLYASNSSMVWSTSLSIESSIAFN